MSELTSDQIRECRDGLLHNIDKLNDLLRDSGDVLTADQIKGINRATRQLNYAITELTAKAIVGTTKELNRAVEGIKDATRNANAALDTLDDIRNIMNIVTALVGLGTAIAAGNPSGIMSSAKDVVTASIQFTTKRRTSK